MASSIENLRKFNSEDFGLYAKIHSFNRHIIPVTEALNYEKIAQSSLDEQSRKYIQK